MTCVVGLVDRGRIYMGADSAGSDSWLSFERRDEKCFLNGPFLMGFTTSFRMGQLLRYSFTPPPRHADEPVERYMATTFIDAVRAALKGGGWATKEKEQESGGVFLVGFEGRLFVVESDYQVGEWRTEYAAIGCGRELALGALHATSGWDPKERLLRALTAAAHFSIGVRPPFVFLETKES